MDLIAVILVLVAAVLHATWNAIVKIDTDRLMTMAVMIGTAGILAPLLLLFGPAPTQESWPYILLSALLNNVYFLFLIEAYRFGDLSLVYPVARGSSPLLVATGAYWFAGEHLDVMELTGVIVISGGIISLVWSADVHLGGARRAVAFSLLTGLMIASYTIIDGIGVRLSGNPAGYIGWLFILNPIPIVIIALARRRRQAFIFLRTNWRLGVLGGGLNLGAYGLAIWALTLGAMAHVSAIRETSVIIAALIGSRLLREPFGRQRVLAATVVTCGVMLIALQN